MSEYSKSYHMLSIAGICLLGLLVAFIVFLYIRKQTHPTATTPEKIPSNRKDSIIYIYSVIVDVVKDSSTALLLTAIAMHETGVFKSKIFRENYNLFGMKQPQRRDTLSLGVKNGYASFASYRDSVQDLLRWFKYNRINLSNYNDIASLITVMKSKGYFEDTLDNYLNACLRHCDEILNLL